MHLLSDLMNGKYVALKSRRQERVADIEKSWKSYTCLSADYRKKTHGRGLARRSWPQLTVTDRLSRV